MAIFGETFWTVPIHKHLILDDLVMDINWKKFMQLNVFTYKYEFVGGDSGTDMMQVINSEVSHIMQYMFSHSAKTGQCFRCANGFI